MATILIPTPLRRFTGNSAKVNIAGNLLSEIITNLVYEFPEVQRHLLDTSGEVRPFLNIFVDHDDIRDLSQQNTPITPASVISIVPAIAGGKI